MKTIFITLFQGTEAKSILRTNIFSKLSSDVNIRLVFFVSSPERAEYYQKKFSHPRVVYESVTGYRSHGWEVFFSKLAFKLLNTETVKLRRKMALEENKNYLTYFFNIAANSLLAKSRVRKLVRRLDYFLVRNGSFSVYFEKYQPSVVFLAHLFDDRS